MLFEAFVNPKWRATRMLPSLALAVALFSAGTYFLYGLYSTVTVSVPPPVFFLWEGPVFAFFFFFLGAAVLRWGFKKVGNSAAPPP